MLNYIIDNVEKNSKQNAYCLYRKTFASTPDLIYSLFQQYTFLFYNFIFLIHKLHTNQIRNQIFQHNILDRKYKFQALEGKEKRTFKNFEFYATSVEMLSINRRPIRVVQKIEAGYRFEPTTPMDSNL